MGFKIITSTMKMMMTRKGSFLLFFSFLTLIAFSQEKDFGIWYGVSADHKLTDKLKIGLSASVRTFDNAAKVEEGFMEGGLEYRLNKYLSIAGSYRLSDNIEDDNSYYFRHKLFFDLKGSYSLGDFSFTGRFRFQERFKTYIEDNEDEIPDSHGRIRLKALYNVPSFPVNPFVSAEFFCPMFKSSDRVVDKNRLMGGIEYNISKRQTIELEYIHQRDYLPHMADENIISVNYNFKF
jgi:hypothetical protein